MVDADESTELWRHPNKGIYKNSKALLYIFGTWQIDFCSEQFLFEIRHRLRYAVAATAVSTVVINLYQFILKKIIWQPIRWRSHCLSLSHFLLSISHTEALSLSKSFSLSLKIFLSLSQNLSLSLLNAFTFTLSYIHPLLPTSSGQSYKASTIIIYESRVIKCKLFSRKYDSGVIILALRGFIRLATWCR